MNEVAPEGGTPTRRAVTIAQLAEELGLSKSAVSNALRGVPLVSAATATRVQRYAQERGWRPNAVARALSLSRSDNVGLVIVQPNYSFGAEAFYMEAIAGIERTLSQHGKNLLLRTINDPAAEPGIYEEWGKEGRVDAVILFDPVVDDVRRDLLAALQLPFFAFGEVDATGLSMGLLAAEESRLIADHLADMGHEQLLFIGGPPNLVHEVERRKGLFHASEDDAMTVIAVETDYSLEMGRQRLLENLDDLEFTAVVASNDILAIGALDGLRSRRRRDVAVVSWDDSLLCQHACIPVTALARHIDELGQVAAGWLLERAYGIEVAEVVRTPSKLVPRRSSKRRRRPSPTRSDPS